MGKMRGMRTMKKIKEIRKITRITTMRRTKFAGWAKLNWAGLGWQASWLAGCLAGWPAWIHFCHKPLLILRISMKESLSALARPGGLSPQWGV